MKFWNKKFPKKAKKREDIILMGLNGYNKGLNNTKRSQLYDIIKMLKVNPLHKQGDLFYTDANVHEVWCSKKDVQLKMS